MNARGEFERHCTTCARVSGETPAPLKDADWLRAQYWDLERSMAQIARRLGCCPETVLRWMVKHEIPRRTASEALVLRHATRSGARMFKKNRQPVTGDGHDDRSPGAVRHLGG